jgi:hypothetical protein
MRFSARYQALGLVMLLCACAMPSGNAAAGPEAALEDI